MQQQTFRRALEAAISAQSVATVVDKAYAFQVEKNNQRLARARYGTVKLAREADAMWDGIVANILAGMSGRSDDQILAQLQDPDFIDTLEEALAEFDFVSED